MKSNDVRVFIRSTGHSRELDKQRVRVDPEDTERAVKEAVAQFLNIDPNELETAIVERTLHGFVVRSSVLF